MYRHWSTFLEPLLEAAAPKVVVEIGVGQGKNTQNLLIHAAARRFSFHAVDPDPAVDVESLAGPLDVELHVHRDQSLDVLARIGPVDFALLDGDHNWYTVYRELHALEEAADTGGQPAPVIVLHDVGWPYGRRDMYYRLEAIPEVFRHPVRLAGILPGFAELAEEGQGLNAHLWNAEREGGRRNGVRTALDDFLHVCRTNFEVRVLEGFHGLAVLVPRERLDGNLALAGFMAEMTPSRSLAQHVRALEEERVAEQIIAAGYARRLQAAGEQKRGLEQLHQDELAALRRQTDQLAESKRQLEEEVEFARAAGEQDRRRLAEELSTDPRHRIIVAAASPAKTLRVIFLVPLEASVGAARAVTEEVLGLRQLGVDAVLAVSAVAMPDLSKAYGHWEEFDDLFIPCSRVEDLVAFAGTFDIAVATTCHTVSVLRRTVAEFPQVRTAYFVQDYEPWLFPKGSKLWDMAVESYSSVPGSTLFANSEWLAEVVRQAHGLIVGRVEPSVETAIFRPSFKGVTCGWPVRITAQVRPSVPGGAPRRTMRVLADLAQEFGARVEITTFGASEPEHRTQALRCDFPHTAVGELTRERLAAHLRETDIFVDLSDYHAFGRMGLEAMASGCAVVLPKQGAAAEYAEHGRNALMVDTSDEGACLSAVREIVTDHALRRSISRSGVATASQYSIRRAAVSLMLMFEDMLQYGRALAQPLKPPDVPAAPGVMPYDELVRRVRVAVEKHTAPGDRVIVASKGDPQLVSFRERVAEHFPQMPDGTYAGHYPATEAEAVGALERLADSGAGYFVLPATAFWWTDFYPEVRRLLYERGSREYADAVVQLFRLPEPATAGASASPPGPRPVDVQAAANGRGGATGPKPLSLTKGPGSSTGRVSKLESSPPDAPYDEIVAGVRATIGRVVRKGARALVVSRGDDDMLLVPGRVAMHFPMDESGVYAGHHPRDGADAIERLEACRCGGAAYFVLPRTSRWWLDYYPALAEHLDARYKRIEDGPTCIVWGLKARTRRRRWPGLPRRTEAFDPSPPSSTRVEVTATTSAEAAKSAGESGPAATHGGAYRQLEALQGRGPVTIIVPVFNAPEEVDRCIDSVLRNTTGNARLLLIDDASTDPAVVPVLERAARHSRVIVLHNDHNVGFVRTVNRGLGCSDGDVVLLNSDTEVGAGWLARLAFAAYSDARVATATPLSNNAGAFSAPIQGGAPLSDAMAFEDIATAVSRSSAGLRPTTPTGHGFCMYIRREALDAVGLFDAEAFPRGYGEETDFCLRAAAKGFIHVIDDRTYVHHAGGKSFGHDRSALIASSRQVLDERYPHYTELVAELKRSPVLEAVRRNVETALTQGSEGKRPRILYVIHAGAGGTPQTNVDLMEHIQDAWEPWLLVSDTRKLDLFSVDRRTLTHHESWPLSSRWRVGDFTREDYRAIILDVLLRLDVSLVHVRHLMGHTFDLPHVARALSIPTVLSLHDFYMACPTIHLLDEKDRFCGGVCTASAGTCRNPTERLAGAPHLKHGWVHQWRRQTRPMLEAVNALVTTSRDTREVFLRAFPGLQAKRFDVIEHGRDLEQRSGAAAPPVAGSPVRILVPGNLAVHKGANLIRDVIAHDLEGRLEFHFLGQVPEAYRDLGVCHGAYEREDFFGWVTKIRPSFVGIFSIWSETYCHTMTEAWAAGVPVIATDIGALRERVLRHGGGWLVDHEDPRRLYEQLLEISDDSAGYERELARANLREVPRAAQMATRYEALYADVLAAERPFATLAAEVEGADPVEDPALLGAPHDSAVVG